METYNDEVKMAELIAVREELYKAKDNAMQSWLDSKPLIDELEKLQTDLANAKNRISMLNIIISELESQLDVANSEIASKMDEQGKTKEITDDINKLLDEKYNELELLKADMEEERKVRSKLKQILRVKRQTLRTFHLTLRAIKIETEACKASKEEAVNQINNSEIEDGVVQIGQGEFYALKRRAKEEEALAEWRISVSLEQKLASEETRKFALSRLKEIRKRKEEVSVGNGGTFVCEAVGEEEERYSSVRVEEDMRSRNDTPRARAEANEKYKRRNARQKKRRATNMRKKHKLSVFSRIRIFLIRSFGRFFK